MAQQQSPSKKKPTIPHLDLYNFEEPWAKETQYVLTSPRSLEACGRCGVQPVQLLYKSLPEFESELSEEKLSYTELYDVYQRTERERQELLKRAREERERIMWSDAERDAVPGLESSVNTSSHEQSATSSASSFASYSSKLSASVPTSGGATAAETTATRSKSAVPGLSHTTHASSHAQGKTNRVKFVRGEQLPGHLPTTSPTPSSTLSSSSSSSSRPASALERRSMQLVGQKLDLHDRAKTPQTHRGGVPSTKSSASTDTTDSSRPSTSTSVTSSNRTASTQANGGPAQESTSSRTRQTSSVPAAVPTDRLRETSRKPSTTQQQQPGLSASATSAGLKRASTASSAPPSRPWSSADGALLASKSSGGHTSDSASSTLWSADELADAVVSVGMSSMEARKMALLSERDRRILQKMVERRRRDTETRQQRQSAELQWDRQAEHRRAERQLEEMEHRKAMEKKREKERAVTELRVAALEQQHREEVDTLQQELEEKEDKWSQLYEEQQERLHQTVREKTQKEERKRQMQELRRVELLVEERQRKRAMLEEKEAKIETAGERKQRLEEEELERLKAKNTAERAAIAARLRDLEDDEAEELLNLQSDVIEKHQRAERRLEAIRVEQQQLQRVKSEKRDRQAERNRDAALQLEHETEQLRLANDEQRREAEHRAAELAQQRVEERRAKTAGELKVRHAAHARNLEKLRNVEQEDERLQRRQLAAKELRMEAMAREREEVVRESRERALEAEVLREKLKEFCSTDTFDKKVQSAELTAPLQDMTHRPIRSAAVNKTSSQVLLG